MSLLAVLFLWAQAPGPEEALRKIEETIQAAGAVRLKIKLEAKVRYRGVELTNTGTGSLLLKKGNRLSLSVQIAMGQVNVESRALSDGTTMRIWADGKERGDLPADPNLVPRVISTVVRGGVSSIGIGLPVATATKKKDPELSSILQLSDFREGISQGTTRSIKFKLKTPNPDESAQEVSLWFDTRSFLPMLRTFSVRIRDVEVTTTETYEDLELDRELPEESFALPPAAPAPPKSKGTAAKAAIVTRTLDPWEGKAEGTWYRFKRTRSEQETYTDLGLKSREAGVNVIVGQAGEKRQVGAVEPMRSAHVPATVLRQETLRIQNREYACDVVEFASGERNWVLRDGRFAGAIVRALTHVGVYQAKTVWEHTLKVKGREFECLVIEAELTLKDKVVESKTWFTPSVPGRHIRIVSEGETLELVDFGLDWSARPAFPGAPDRQL